jgi:hypothetical protein
MSYRRKRQRQTSCNPILRLLSLVLGTPGKRPTALNARGAELGVVKVQVTQDPDAHRDTPVSLFFSSFFLLFSYRYMGPRAVRSSMALFGLPRTEHKKIPGKRPEHYHTQLDGITKETSKGERNPFGLGHSISGQRSALGAVSGRRVSSPVNLVLWNL